MTISLLNFLRYLRLTALLDSSPMFKTSYYFIFVTARSSHFPLCLIHWIFTSMIRSYSQAWCVSWHGWAQLSVCVSFSLNGFPALSKCRLSWTSKGLVSSWTRSTKGTRSCTAKGPALQIVCNFASSLSCLMNSSFRWAHFSLIQWSIHWQWEPLSKWNLG